MIGKYRAHLPNPRGARGQMSCLPQAELPRRSLLGAYSTPTAKDVFPVKTLIAAALLLALIVPAHASKFRESDRKWLPTVDKFVREAYGCLRGWDEDEPRKEAACKTMDKLIRISKIVAAIATKGQAASVDPVNGIEAPTALKMGVSLLTPSEGTATRLTGLCISASTAAADRGYWSWVAAATASPSASNPSSSFGNPSPSAAHHVPPRPDLSG